MDQRQARQYLLGKPFSSVSFPFGEEIAVFKVKHKMFATLSVGKMPEKGKDDENIPLEGERIYWMNLKCDPQEALMLRDIFPAVIPGYHMNKLHWNTVKLDGSIPQGEIQRMMDNSFELVVQNMPKKDQQSVLLHL